MLATHAVPDGGIDPSDSMPGAGTAPTIMSSCTVAAPVIFDCSNILAVNSIHNHAHLPNMGCVTWRVEGFLRRLYLGCLSSSFLYCSFENNQPFFTFFNFSLY